MKSTAPAIPKRTAFPFRPITAGVFIGHIHLKVGDLERAVAFYRDVLGFEVAERFGREAAFLSAGGYHHHIGLNTWESRDGHPPAPGTKGLYHARFFVPRVRTLRTLCADCWPTVFASTARPTME